VTNVASQDLKRLIARDLAAGERPVNIARRHGISDRTVRNLRRDPEVLRHLADERGLLEALVERHRAALVLAGKAAAERVCEAVGNPLHPRALETSRWLLDKLICDRKSDQNVNVRHGVDVATMESLVSRLQHLRSTLPKEPIDIANDPQIFEGETALPQAAVRELRGSGTRR